MTLWNETKSVPVSREMVWLAYKKVRANGGSSGIDQVSMEIFDQDRSRQLYKLWNRLSSGSYFPPPVKEVEIPKKDGKVRQLGISIVHCKSQRQAEWILARIKERMQSCGLELHPDKTKIVYCRDHCRKESYSQVKFDFLGYSFQPRTCKSKRDGKLFLGFDCAISISSKKRIADKMEELNIVGLTHKSIAGVAQFLNPFIRGWVNYYGKFRKSAMNPVFHLLSKRLIRWAMKRYKRYKSSPRRAWLWYNRVWEQFPGLFYHWQVGITG